MRWPVIAVTCLLTCGSALAGVEFRFHAFKTGDPPLQFAGTGWIEDQDFRMELDSGNHPFFHPGALVIHQNGGGVIVVVDRRAQTYFMRTTDRMRGTVSTFNAPWQHDVRDISVKLRPRETRQEIAGQQAIRYDLEISYTIWMLVEDTAMKAKVHSSAELWLSDVEKNDAIPYGFHYALKTGFAEVDKRVSKALLGRGIPLKQVVTTSRSIEGEPPVTETMTSEVDSITVRDIPVSNFRVGNSYRYKEPAVTIPERSD